MGRWFGLRPWEVGDLLLTDVWRYERFMASHPPVDLLYAAKMNYNAPEKKDKPKSIKEAARSNRAALAQAGIPLPDPKRLPKLPANMRSPELLGIIDEMRAQCQTTS